jgi:riboflavin kinase
LNKENNLFHLPDLLFIRYCHEQFGINRGVYNTIDSWLFQKGITDILDRRETIFHFLSKWLQEDQEKNQGKIKIGHGNLTKRLTDYFESALSQNHLVS